MSAKVARNTFRIFCMKLQIAQYLVSIQTLKVFPKVVFTCAILQYIFTLHFHLYLHRALATVNE